MTTYLNVAFVNKKIIRCTKHPKFNFINAFYRRGTPDKAPEDRRRPTFHARTETPSIYFRTHSR